MIQVIVETHAASLNTGEEFQNYTTTNQILTQQPRKDVFSETTASRLTVSTTRSPLFIEPNLSPVRIPRPFVLWWSTVAQSVLELLRQRSLIRETARTISPHHTVKNVTQEADYQFEVDINDVNDVAAGLDTIFADSPPVFDQTPTE